MDIVYEDIPTPPIDVFVKTAQGMQVEETLLEESLAKNTKAVVQIHWMRRGEAQFQKWECDKLFKWAIPELMFYRSFAVYLDVQSYVQGDISKLYHTWAHPGVWRCAVNTHVSVIDCSAFAETIPKIKVLRKMGKDFDFEITQLVKPQPIIPHEWNADEEFASRDSLLIRYDDVKNLEA